MHANIQSKLSFQKNILADIAFKKKLFIYTLPKNMLNSPKEFCSHHEKFVIKIKVLPFFLKYTICFEV